MYAMEHVTVVGSFSGLPSKHLPEAGGRRCVLVAFAWKHATVCPHWDSGPRKSKLWCQNGVRSTGSTAEAPSASHHMPLKALTHCSSRAVVQQALS